MTIAVEGLRDLVRGLREADRTTLARLGEVHRELADLIEREAERRAPKRSGRLARSLRSRGTPQSASVLLGGGRVVYAGLQEFGGTVPARGQKGLGRFSARSARQRAALMAGQRIRIKPYRGPSGPRRPWWEDDSGYFLHPAARAKREEILARYAELLDQLTERAFPAR